MIQCSSVYFSSEKGGKVAQMVLYARSFLNRRYLNGYSTLNVLSAVEGGGDQKFVSATCALHGNQVMSTAEGRI